MHVGRLEGCKRDCVLLMQFCGCLCAAKCSLLCRYVTRERVEAMLDYEVRHCSSSVLCPTKTGASPVLLYLATRPLEGMQFLDLKAPIVYFDLA